MCLVTPTAIFTQTNRMLYHVAYAFRGLMQGAYSIITGIAIPPTRKVSYPQTTGGGYGKRVHAAAVEHYDPRRHGLGHLTCPAPRSERGILLEADARLAARAPDLLEALQAMSHEFEQVVIVPRLSVRLTMPRTPSPRQGAKHCREVTYAMNVKEAAKASRGLRGQNSQAHFRRPAQEHEERARPPRHRPRRPRSFRGSLG